MNFLRELLFCGIKVICGIEMRNSSNWDCRNAQFIVRLSHIIFSSVLHHCCLADMNGVWPTGCSKKVRPLRLKAHILCLRHRGWIMTIDYCDVTAPYLLIPYSSNLSYKVAPPGEMEYLNLPEFAGRHWSTRAFPSGNAVSRAWCSRMADILNVFLK